MDRKVRKIFSILLFALAFVIIGYTIWIPKSSSNEKNRIAVMLHYPDGSEEFALDNGLYQPASIYTFDDERSSCVNGSVISYEKDRGVSVALKGNDVCTVHYNARTPDGQIKILVDGVRSSTAPTEGNYDVSVSCSGATGEWNYGNWALSLTRITQESFDCTVSFTKPKNSNTLISSIEHSEDTVKNGESEEYIYRGDNPDNYVLYNGEMWRILGVYDRTLAGEKGIARMVKIMRPESIGNYYAASVKDISRILNNYYYMKSNGNRDTKCLVSEGIKGNCDYRYRGLKERARNMAENVIWGTDSEMSGYVGLLSKEDYIGSGVECESEEECTSTWLVGSVGALIDDGYHIDNRGHIAVNAEGEGYSVYPVVYLKSSTYLISGTGSPTDPYIIN